MCIFEASHSNHRILYLYPCVSVSHFRSIFTYEYLQFAFHFKSRPSVHPLHGVILLTRVFHPRISWRAIDESALKTHTRSRLRVSWSLSVTSAASRSRAQSRVRGNQAINACSRPANSSVIRHTIRLERRQASRPTRTLIRQSGASMSATVGLRTRSAELWKPGKAVS